MATTTKQKANKVPTETAYAQALERLASNTVKVREIINKSEATISKEMAKRHEKVGDMPDQIKEDEEIIKAYCEANRKLMFSQSNILTFKHGKFGFRIGQYSVVTERNDSEIIEALKKRNLEVYVVVKESLDRKGLITDREDAALTKVLDKIGVSIEQSEKFFITVN